MIFIDNCNLKISLFHLKFFYLGGYHGIRLSLLCNFLARWTKLCNCSILMQELNIGGSIVTSALEEACGTSRSKIRNMYNSLGDLGRKR